MPAGQFTSGRATADRLVRAQHSDGGWPYFARGDSALEPTATAVAALYGHGQHADAVRRGIDFIAAQTARDGALRPQPTQRESTALAALAGTVLVRCGGDRRVAERIADTLRDWSVRTLLDQDVFGNDTSLRGFPWTPDTFSWVEPTAYGVLLFEALGRSAEPRIEECRRLLVDRAIPGGGWNYGNPKVFGTVLEPDPHTTAVALLALLDDPTRPAVREAVDYLRRQTPHVPSALTLGWMLMARAACGDSIADDAAQLETLLTGAMHAVDSPWHLAAALLTCVPLERNPLILPERPAA